MDESGFPSSWAEAAALAAFDCYELVSPAPDRRWAGGYGSDHRGPSHLEILHAVDGVEVSVETYHGDGSGVQLRLLIHQMLWRAVMQARDFQLPITLTLEGDDLLIDIDGVPATFEGARLAGRNRWVGATQLGNGDNVTISIDGPVVPLGIARRTDLSMPDTLE